MGLHDPNAWKIAILSGVVALIASALTAFLNSRLQLYLDRERWQKDFALKLAEFQSSNPSQSGQVAKQFAIGLLLVDTSEEDGYRQREFIPFYGCLTVGADEANDIVVKDELCSGKHLLFFATHSEVYVLDLKSQNGTWVNGKRLSQRRRLEHGDKITLAERNSATKVTFVAIDRSAA